MAFVAQSHTGVTAAQSGNEAVTENIQCQQKHRRIGEPLQVQMTNHMLNKIQ